MFAQRIPVWIWPLLVAVVAGSVYLNTLGNGFALDDITLVRDNPDIRSTRGLLLEPYWHESQGGAASGLYRPVTIISLAVNRALTGPEPAGFHLVNLLLHSLVCLLAWFALRASGAYRGTALLAGLFFAVHPLHTEAVSNISGRAELLAACFVLAAWPAHRRAIRASTWTGRLSWSALAALAYLLGLLSKEHAVLAPLLFLLDDARSPATGESAPGLTRRALPYGFHAAALLGALSLRFLALGGLRGADTMAFIDNPAAALGTFPRLATALWVQARYAGSFLWPLRLSSDYSFDAIPSVVSPADPRLAVGVVWCVALGVFAVLAWRRSRPLLLAAAIWSLFLLPTSNLPFATGTVMAERLAYLPSLGACLLLGHAGAWLASPQLTIRWASPRVRSGIVLVVAGALLALLAARTVVRNPEWRDNLTLALHDSRSMPRSAKLQAGAGIALYENGDLAGAEERFRNALEIYPDYAQIHYNLGQLLAARGAGDDALFHLRRAAEISPLNPRPHKQLAPLLARAGRLEAALESYAAGSRLDPDDLPFRFNYCRVLLAVGRRDEAVGELDRLSRDDPGGLVGRLALALLKESRGDPRVAAQIYRELLAGPGLPGDVRARIEQRLRNLGER